MKSLKKKKERKLITNRETFMYYWSPGMCIFKKTFLFLHGNKIHSQVVQIVIVENNILIMHIPVCGDPVHAAGCFSNNKYFNV